MRLDLFNNTSFSRGRPVWIEALWFFVQALFITSWIPGSVHRKLLLRLFGAKIGKGTLFKPGVKVKFPWRLEIGEHTWIGEDVWIDNLAKVTIGSHCCISQGVYLCTGSHDWSKKRFNLITKPITVMDKAWLCAKSIIGPGVTVNEGAVLGIGSLATEDLKAWWIYQGVPSTVMRERLLESK